ncbi:MAG: hypothetical protein MJZ91_09465 [Bacteroidales bacterium]|nr:hypothetical protein [Bacteroidales bacterium]
MKKYLSIIIGCLMLAFATSCDPVETNDVDPNQIFGKWHDGTVYERYDADGTGATWDTADDVTEEEAQTFSWSLNGTRLAQEHHGEMSFVVYKEYNVTKLDAYSFSYEDDYGFGYSFVRVN